MNCIFCTMELKNDSSSEEGSHRRKVERILLVDETAGRILPEYEK